VCSFISTIRCPRNAYCMSQPNPPLVMFVERLSQYIQAVR
jgi:hypothetical protein